MSILRGIPDLVDDWLGIEPKGSRPYYRHKSAAYGLSARSVPVSGALEFLESAYGMIEENWLTERAKGHTNPSRENWRWKRHTRLAKGNQSPEVVLERTMVADLGDDWCNQVPVASGLAGPVADKRAAIDLVNRHSSTSFEFIELKVASDNPLFAAIEILLYGLVFIWSKENQSELGYDVSVQPLLAAESVNLSVLAPSAYYSGFQLADVQTALVSGLAEFGLQRGLNLKFGFSSLKDQGVYEGISREEVRPRGKLHS